VKSKAAILAKLSDPLKIISIEIPPPAVGQVLVKVHYSGLCGKQMGEQSGFYGPDKFLPHCLGHEAGVEVISIGAGVSKFKKGDHCVAHLVWH
jgi:S-(hydroxymethyl)glutathione dehydrogenase / alcohol dehydrogenase